jgi:hypothetical protein
MPKTLFAKHLNTVDAAHFKRVGYQTVRSDDRKSVRLEGTATTGIAEMSHHPQQNGPWPKETEMNIEELVTALNNLSAAEKTQVIGALSATQHQGPLSALDRLLASASPERHGFIKRVYAEAQRVGVTVPADGRKLQIAEVNKMIQSSDRFLPGDTETKIRFKMDLAGAGISE